MSVPKNYWFSAKDYGYGWGLPCAWQGWVALGIYIVAISGFSLLVSPVTNLASFIIGISLLSAFLLVICYYKGEPLKWRWGREKANNSQGGSPS